MGDDRSAHEQWIAVDVSDSLNRLYTNEKQPTYLRDLIRRANIPADRAKIRGDIGGDRSRVRELRREFEGRPPLEWPMLARAKWHKLHADLGAQIGVLAKWEPGFELARFFEAVAYFEVATGVPSHADDGYQWSLYHNNKGAVHYWFAVWLAGGPGRGLLGEVAPGALDACTDQMRLALHHYDLALTVRSNPGFLNQAVIGEFRPLMFAQTLQNIGTARTHLAWWSKDPQLARAAIPPLQHVESLFDEEKVRDSFPHLGKDIEHAQAVLRNLTPNGNSGNNGFLSNETGVATVPHDTDAPKPDSTPLASDFADATLGELESALVPMAPEGSIDRLEELVRSARDEPPSDIEGFVTSVNRILDAHNLRFQVGDGLARLSTRRDAIHYAISRQGRHSLKVAEPKLVPVPLDYANRNRKRRDPAVEPS